MNTPFNVNLTVQQANLMIEALEEKLSRESGDEERLALIYSIECVLNSGIAHTKEK